MAAHQGPHPWDSPGKNTGVGCHFLLQCMKVKSESEVKSLRRVRLLATTWTAAYQSSPSLGFTRQEHWSGLPFPSPGDLPNTGIEPRSPTLGVDSSPAEPPEKPKILEWVAFPFSRGSSQHRDQTQISHITDGFFTS